VILTLLSKVGRDEVVRVEAQAYNPDAMCNLPCDSRIQCSRCEMSRMRKSGQWMNRLEIVDSQSETTGGASETKVYGVLACGTVGTSQR
jgi:hypothetical protein